MKVYVNLKQAGKRRPVLSQKEYEIGEEVRSLRDILTYFTLTELDRYNKKSEDSCLLYLTGVDIAAKAEEGKVGFGRRYNEKTVTPQKACEETLQAFTDGLVRVFLRDKELTGLDDKVEIVENDTFTFIRLTFLAGRMW